MQSHHNGVFYSSNVNAVSKASDLAPHYFLSVFLAKLCRNALVLGARGYSYSYLALLTISCRGKRGSIDQKRVDPLGDSRFSHAENMNILADYRLIYLTFQIRLYLLAKERNKLARGPREHYDRFGITLKSKRGRSAEMIWKNYRSIGHHRLLFIIFAHCSAGTLKIRLNIGK